MPVYVRRWFIDEMQSDAKAREKSADSSESQWGVDMDTPISKIMQSNS